MAIRNLHISGLITQYTYKYSRTSWLETKLRMFSDWNDFICEISIKVFDGGEKVIYTYKKFIQTFNFGLAMYYKE